MSFPLLNEWRPVGSSAFIFQGCISGRDLLLAGHIHFGWSVDSVWSFSMFSEKQGSWKSRKARGAFQQWNMKLFVWRLWRNGGWNTLPWKKHVREKNRPKRPKRKTKNTVYQPFHFQVRTVSFREGMYSKMLSEPRKIPWLFRVYRGMTSYPVI